MSMKLDAHVFVCTNRKEKGSCCGGKGGAKLREDLKALASDKHPEWKGRVRINASGCLGRCEDGIVAVMYPQAQWFTHLKEDDSPVLLQALRDTLK